jgi:uncharacterized protein YggE
MIRPFLLASLLIFSFTIPALAEDTSKPDDMVAFNLVAEDWVTTKTAHVTLDVEAAVSAATAGSMRADMANAVNEVAKSDWRLVGFNRSQDQTGMERWSVSFDARLPESDLGTLADAAKKASKAGMQISVSNVDFSPTLEETEATRAGLRTHLIKEASDQLATLNTELPGRTYRIAQIDFDTDNTPPQPRMLRKPVGMAMSMMSEPQPAAPLERSEKITLIAHVVYAAVPPVAAH